KDGRPSMAVARRGRDLSFSVLNVETVFLSRLSLDFNPDRRMSDGICIGDMKIALAEDKRTATLTILRGGASLARASINAEDLDKLIALFGEMRAAMPMQTSLEPKLEPGNHELVMVDPAWRTNVSVHADLDGIDEVKTSRVWLADLPVASS